MKKIEPGSVAGGRPPAPHRQENLFSPAEEGVVTTRAATIVASSGAKQRRSSPERLGELSGRRVSSTNEACPASASKLEEVVSSFPPSSHILSGSLEQTVHDAADGDPQRLTASALQSLLRILSALDARDPEQRGPSVSPSHSRATDGEDPARGGNTAVPSGPQDSANQTRSTPERSGQ